MIDGERLRLRLSWCWGYGIFLLRNFGALELWIGGVGLYWEDRRVGWIGGFWFWGEGVCCDGWMGGEI